MAVNPTGRFISYSTVCLNHASLQVHGFWLVQDAVMTLLSREEVCPRSNLSLALGGTSLDPLAELQSLKGLKPGAIVRLVEGSKLLSQSISYFLQ